jgi:hypothetical protein
MRARIEIEVKDRKEARFIERALMEADVKAFAVIVGALMPHPRRMQMKMLDFAKEALTQTEPAK